MIINKRINNENRSDAIRLARILDKFNNGRLYPETWPHCPEYDMVIDERIFDIISSIFIKFISNNI
jgi:hypothetical protein